MKEICLIAVLSAPAAAALRVGLPAPVLPTVGVSAPIFAPRLNLAPAGLPAVAMPAAAVGLVPAAVPAAPVLQGVTAAPRAAAAASQAAVLPAAAEAARPALAGKASWVQVFDGTAKTAVNGALDARPEPAYASARTAYELYREVDSYYTRLAAIHDADRKGAKDLSARKRQVWNGVAGLDDRLNGKTDGGFAAASARLKAAHAANSAAKSDLYGKMRAAAGAPAIGAASAEVRRAASELVSAQVRAARLMLDGAAPLNSREARRNAALMTLLGARTTALSLYTEVAYGEARTLRARAAAAPLEVPVRRWHNAQTLLDEAARDARNGRPAAAERTLSGVETLFTQTPGLLEPGVAARAEEVRGRVAEARRALAAGEGEAAAGAIAAARDAVPNPKLDAQGTAVYKDADSAQRARAHQLETMSMEFEVVTARASELGFWGDVLASAGAEGESKRPMTDMEAAAFSTFLANTRAWTGRGFVRGKQEASEKLAAAAEAAEAGSYSLAAARLDAAREALEARAAELERIRSAVAARPERAVSADTRHAALVEAAARWRRMLRRPLDASKADDLAGEVRNHRAEYLSEPEPGLPGYARAAKDLAELDKALLAGDRAKARALVERFEENLVHRRSLRFYIAIRQDKEGGTVRRAERFALPGTTLKTLLKRVGGIPERPEVRLNGGAWTPYAGLDLRGTPADETLVEILLPPASLR